MLLLTDQRKRNQMRLAVNGGGPHHDHIFENPSSSVLFRGCMIGILATCIVVLWFSFLMGNINITHNRRQLSEEVVGDIDFSGGHNPNRAYRLGDVFVMWYTWWKTFDAMLERYEHDYPNTLAHRYLLEVGEEKYGNRNLTALMRVNDDWTLDQEQQHYKQHHKKEHFQTARDDELLVHVRLGDVLTSEEYTDTSVPMMDFWKHEEGIVCRDAGVKYVYNKAEFRELFRRIPKNTIINRVVIVGAGFITDEEHDYRNKEYLGLVASLLHETFSCPVVYHTANNPDADLVYMASANWLITGMGGYAQIAAACVNAYRGHGHAIFDKFNGEIASWNYPKFTPKERAIFRDSYVDWSRM